MPLAVIYVEPVDLLKMLVALAVADFMLSSRMTWELLSELFAAFFCVAWLFMDRSRAFFILVACVPEF